MKTLNIKQQDTLTIKLEPDTQKQLKKFARQGGYENERVAAEKLLKSALEIQNSQYSQVML